MYALDFFDLFKTSFGRFRIVAFLEGLSYIALFLVSMPLKYMYGIGEPNKVIGMIHGALFILFVLMLIGVQADKKWSFKTTVLVFISSLLPLGTFVAEHKLFKNS